MTAEIYHIGYRKPPRHTQFKKGRSGNPNGRPKPSDVPHPKENRFTSLALEEAYRLVPIEENGKVRKYPVIQLVLRRMFAEAAKNGTIGAARMAIDVIRPLEAKNHKDHFAVMGHWADYKRKWEASIAKHVKMGYSRVRLRQRDQTVRAKLHCGDIRQPQIRAW